MPPQLSGKLDPLQALEALQQKDPRAYQLLLQLPGGDTFLASTPERLYVRSGEAVASEAVAGTRPRGPPGGLPGWLSRLLCCFRLCGCCALLGAVPGHVQAQRVHAHSPSSCHTAALSDPHAEAR